MSNALLFQPLFHTRVWGGRTLETLLGKALPDDGQPYGESWEIVDREEAQSIVLNGPHAGRTLNELWTSQRESVFGSALLDHPAERFPLLMKILDARDDLSIQVHPPAEAAPDLGGEPKTEMWFIAHADSGAKIYAGLKKDTTRAEFEAALRLGKVADLIHVIEPRTGDCLFIPSGRIHAIGAGLLIYEIQQNSDTTYRVFDWNRVGLDGQPRQLHLDESMRSIDFTDFEPEMQNRETDGTLVRCPFFVVRRRTLADCPPGSLLVGSGTSLTLALTAGSITLADGTILNAGAFALLPASAPEGAFSLADASPDVAWLEIDIP